MTKTLTVMLAIFALAFCGFGYLGINEIKVRHAIAEGPAVTLATPAAVRKVSRKRTDKFRVAYQYQVAGATYSIDSKAMNEADSQAALAGPALEVTYAIKRPALAAFKRDFDRRDPNETPGSALRFAAAMAFLVALCASLLLGWQFGWLRMT